MSGDNWNPWKAAVIGMAVVATTVLVTAAGRVRARGEREWPGKRHRLSG